MMKFHGNFYIIVKTANLYFDHKKHWIEIERPGFVLVLTVTHCVNPRGHDLHGHLTSEMSVLRWKPWFFSALINLISSYVNCYAWQIPFSLELGGILGGESTVAQELIRKLAWPYSTMST